MTNDGRRNKSKRITMMFFCFCMFSGATHGSEGPEQTPMMLMEYTRTVIQDVSKLADDFGIVVDVLSEADMSSQDNRREFGDASEVLESMQYFLGDLKIYLAFLDIAESCESNTICEGLNFTLILMDIHQKRTKGVSGLISNKAVADKGKNASMKLEEIKLRLDDFSSIIPFCKE